MIEIPFGKALVPVETTQTTHEGCWLFEQDPSFECCHLACIKHDRRDGKNVIFKLVDYPASELHIDGMRNGSQVTSGR
jgi:hypothetical protein